ncbi:MAG: gamma carbonic anhydrase family protein [Leucobacter sp.]
MTDGQTMDGTADRHGRVIAIEPYGAPALDPTVWLAPGSCVIGDVELGPGCSVWYNAVLRADSNSIRVGARTNFQDGVIIHTERDGTPTVIGDDVSFGHNAIAHGCVVENGCLIGMNATVLSGAVIGEGSLVAAGAVVREGSRVPPHSLVAGVPAKVLRELTEEERVRVRANSEFYLEYTESHRRATRE